MESNKLQELQTSYMQMERRLQRLKLGKKYRTQIQRDYSSFFEPDGKPLLQIKPFILYKQEGDIDQSFKQQYELLCQLYQSTKLLQVDFKEVATKLRTKLEGKPNLNNTNTQCNNIELKSKKIGKSTLLNSRFCKFKLFMKNNRLRQTQILIEKLAQISNQMLSLQTKFVELNFENQKSIEIKIFINTDLMLNITNEEDHKNDKIQVKMENSDSKIEETRILNHSCFFKNEQIILNQRKSLTYINENLEQKPPLINRSKKISFKELVQKIDLENKLNEKKQSNMQKLGSEIKNQEQKLNNYTQIKQEEVIINNQDYLIQNEEQQKKEKQVIQKIQSFYPQNQQEVETPDKIQGITNKASGIENTRMDYDSISKEKKSTIINIDFQDNTFDEQDSCQIIFINQPNQQDNQNEFNSKKTGQKNVVNNQNQQNVLEKQRLLKNEENSNNQDQNEIFTLQKIHQFYKENLQSVLRQRYKFKKQQRQLECQQQKNIRKQKLKDLTQLKVQERKRQREIKRKIKLEKELEERKSKQKKKDRINEMKKQQLENKIQKEQLKQKHIQFFKERNRKERNTSKNRSFSSQSCIEQFQKFPSNLRDENSQVNNYKKEEQYLDPQLCANQHFCISEQQQSQQNIKEDNKCQTGQQKQQIEDSNLTPYQYHPQFAQYYPFNILNYGQQDQFSQFQFPFAQQPYSSFIGNPFFQYQCKPINLIEQQSTPYKIDGQHNVNTAQLQLEMINFLKIGLEHLNPTQFFQFSPQTFLPTENSKGQYKIE